jgi:hypothetical protein
MESIINKVIKDISGYRTFSDTIDIKFVCALLENVYLKEESAQIEDILNDITEEEIRITGGKTYDEVSFIKGANWIIKKIKNK